MDKSFSEGGEIGNVHKLVFDGNNIETSDAIRLQEQIMRGSTYEKLSNEQCIKEYAKTLVENRGDVVLVIDKPTGCDHRDRYGTDFGPPGGTEKCANTSVYDVKPYRQDFSSAIRHNWYGWICSRESFYDIPDGEKKCFDGAWKERWNAAESWTVFGAHVNYCYSERLPGKCQLKVASNLLYLVIATNVIKLMILLALTTTRFINQDPIVTLGDAAASFIESPEPRTKGSCLGWFGYDEDFPKPFQPTTKRWYAGASRNRWIAASLL